MNSLADVSLLVTPTRLTFQNARSNDTCCMKRFNTSKISACRDLHIAADQPILQIILTVLAALSNAEALALYTTVS